MRKNIPVIQYIIPAALLLALAACSGPAGTPDDGDPQPTVTFELNPAEATCEPGDGPVPEPVLHLRWEPPGQATAYDVYRNGELLEAGLPAAVTTYTDAGVAPGGTWTYRIVASRPDGPASSQEISRTIPEQACWWTATATGTNHTLGLMHDGTVWAWGDNGVGQLGNGTTDQASEPGKVHGLEDVKSIAAGAFTSLALKNDGTVWAWGSGPLGDGSGVTGLVPVQVTGLEGAGTVRSIHAGALTRYVLFDDGTVMAWGDNEWGQLGRGPASEETERTPVQVTGLEDVATLVAGYLHAFAVLGDGTVMGWGNNVFGQLGTGDREHVYSPTPITALAEYDITQLSTGRGHSLALLADGTVLSWGRNEDGQLGLGGSSEDREDEILKPVPVKGLPADGVTGVTAGFSHSVALLTDRTALGWGSNNAAQLGSDVAGARNPTPAPVPGLSSVTDIRTDLGSHNSALRDDGTIWTWGPNNYGQLGYATEADRDAAPRHVIVP